MNQRIRLLALQAGFFPEPNWEHTAWHAAGHNNTFEKFALLIVRECCEVVKWTPSQFSNDEYVKNIQEHFGVEE